MNGLMTDPIAELEQATRVVAGLFTGPTCVEATALLLEVAMQLGHKVEARAVSLFATDLETGHQVTGQRGQAFGESFLARRGISAPLIETFAGGTPFQIYAGHMIVVSEEFGLLMDPTFDQFEPLGEQATPIFAQNVRLRSNSYWQVISDDLYVRYFAADEFADLDFSEARAQTTGRAKKIAAHIRGSRT
ncbi:hypothetical protein GCM10010471_25380 [Leucobacter komagatae]